MNELSSIGKKSWKDIAAAIISQGWIFETKFEKLVVTVCVAWTLYSLVKFVVGIF